MTPRPIALQGSVAIVHQPLYSADALLRLFRRIASWFGARKDVNEKRDVGVKSKKRGIRDIEHV
jgi:hypothetical protein